jgi:hypothetical protein
MYHLTSSGISTGVTELHWYLDPLEMDMTEASYDYWKRVFEWEAAHPGRSLDDAKTRSFHCGLSPVALKVVRGELRWHRPLHRRLFRTWRER